MCTYTYYSCLGRVMAESCATFEPVWRAHEASYAACLDQCTDTNNCEQGYWYYVTMPDASTTAAWRTSSHVGMTTASHPYASGTTDDVAGYTPTAAQTTNAYSTTASYAGTDTPYYATGTSSFYPTTGNWNYTGTAAYNWATTAADTFYLQTTGVIDWMETSWIGTTVSDAWYTTTDYWTSAIETETIGQDYGHFHRIAIATRARTNSAWKRSLSLVLGLEVGEMRDTETFQANNGDSARMFVFNVASDKLCAVYGQLNALPFTIAQRLSIGGVDMVLRREEFQFRKDGSQLEGGAAHASASLLVGAAALSAAI